MQQLWHGVLFRQRPDHTFESITPRAREWTGLDPYLSWQAIHPADVEKANSDNARFRLRHAQTWRITWVEQRRRPTEDGYEGYWEDVSSQVRLARELAHAHWKATLGTATQRLVHDFNNLLTGILSLSDAYLLRAGGNNAAIEGLQLINQNARQAADIVQQIGGMFRERPGKRAHHNLAQLGASAADMLRRVLPKHSTLKLETRDDSIPVYLDAAELKQSIVSLALALTPPIHMEVAVAHKEARITVSGLNAPTLPALLMAEAFAERNDARFEGQQNRYSFHIPEANFSEEERPQRSLLLVAPDTPEAFKIADLLRRNSYQVVIGNRDLLDSSDYRFDGTMELAGLAADQDTLATVNRLFEHVA